MAKIRTGQAPAPLTRDQFRERFNVRFYDPAFEVERDAIARLEAIAWDAVQDGRKAPITQPAGRVSPTAVMEPPMFGVLEPATGG